MHKELLRQVYQPEHFKEKGHVLIDQLSQHLDDKLNGKSTNAIHWKEPDEELNFWREFLVNGNDDDLFQEITQRTTYVHHPHYIGHQVCAPAPLTALTGLISALLNNGTAIYEMGMSSNAIERIIIEFLCSKLGYNQDSGGFLTSGGTLANLTALLSARKAILKEDVWVNGTTRQLGIMVSEEAHYCVDRAARIMGLGDQGIIKVPVTDGYQLNTELLENKFREAESKGITIFAVVGSAPSTATGIFDDLATIATFAHKNSIWFHVDGAHGGAGIFSKKYAHTVKGIEKADSVVIDGHKMMMMPALTTALLFKNRLHSNVTFMQKADYLLTESEHEDWYNSGKRTFECTKNMMGIHWFALLKVYGEEVFEANVTHLYDMGLAFTAMIRKNTCFQLAVQPMCNIVCFRYLQPGLSLIELNTLNSKIRQSLLADGEFYIVQTKLRGLQYMRVTVMNPFTTVKHLQHLLDKIKTIAQSLQNT